jgi:ubiquinone/menaquinone biosynthesis C-methylase UbiE
MCKDAEMTRRVTDDRAALDDRDTAPGSARAIWEQAPVDAIPSTLSIPHEAVELAQHSACVVDLGCGNGLDASELQSGSHETIGVDVNGEALKAATERRRRGLSFVKADATYLPFKSNSVDLFTAQALLTVIPVGRERRLLLKEVRRVIRDDGTLCVSDFVQNWELPLYSDRYEANLERGGERGTFLASSSGRSGKRFHYHAHHSTEHELKALVAGLFEIQTFRTELVVTANHNKTTGFVAVCKPSR